MDFQIFFLFFPTKWPLQLNKTSFTVSGKTHLTPTSPRTNSQRALATIQWIRTWFTDSFAQPHKKQQLGNCHPLLWSLSSVNTFPHVASHAKKATLVGTLSTQMHFSGKTVSMGLTKQLYASLTLNLPFFPPFQETESSSKDGLSPLSLRSKSPTMPTSQSLKFLKNLRLQPPWSEFWSHISSTVAFLLAAKAKRCGKVWDSAVPAHHTSVQNLI